MMIAREPRALCKTEVLERTETRVEPLIEKNQNGNPIKPSVKLAPTAALSHSCVMVCADSKKVVVDCRTCCTPCHTGGSTETAHNASCTN